LNAVSALALDTSHAEEIECCPRNGEAAPPQECALPSEDSMTALIEQLNCLEFETSQLNHAYQLWRSNVEQGTAPEWMAAAITVSYDALMTFCLNAVSALALDTGHADEIEYSPHNGEAAPGPEPSLPAEDGLSSLFISRSEWLQCDDAETDPQVRWTAVVDGSLALTPQNRIVGVLALTDVPHAFSARHLAQLEAASQISDILGEESTTVLRAEPDSELLPMTEPDWSGSSMPATIPPPSNGHAISDRPAIQKDQREEEIGAESATILATLRLPDWLQGFSTRRFFGAASLAILAAVAMLVVVGGSIGIYMASPHRAAPKSFVPLAAAGAIVVPTGEVGFKFDPDPVVAPLGSTFVVNAVLSRGSDIASVAVQIDYDANLLQFMGVAQGGFLAKPGQQFVLAQRNDPLTGVLKISAQQSPGKPGISGDGPVFALSFQARQRGTATVSIVPSAHDSQGRRIEMAGSQASVRVN
jgi:hypothetical protein